MGWNPYTICKPTIATSACVGLYREYGATSDVHYDVKCSCNATERHGQWRGSSPSQPTAIIRSAVARGLISGVREGMMYASGCDVHHYYTAHPALLLMDNIKGVCMQWCTLSVQNIKNTCSFHDRDQVNPGESYDPLLMWLLKSTSISVDEGEETGSITIFKPWV